MIPVMTSKKTVGDHTNDDDNAAASAQSKSFFTHAGNSSKYHGWETPIYLADLLSKAVGGFDLDPCAATHDIGLARIKARTLLTVEDDGLNRDWAGKVFCNPPYGRLSTGIWVRKCANEADKGATVVALLPSRTCTKWWHDHVGQADIFMLKGRLKFGDGKTPAPFASAIVVWNSTPELVAALCAALPDAMHIPRKQPISVETSAKVQQPVSSSSQSALMQMNLDALFRRSSITLPNFQMWLAETASPFRDQGKPTT